MPKGTLLAYVAGPYSTENKSERGANVLHAENTAIELMKLDYTPIIPHKNFYAMEERENELNYTFLNWMRHCLILMLRCDLVVFTQGWHGSRGASIEHTVAEAMGMRIVYEDEDGNLRIDRDGDGDGDGEREEKES